jgi:hypothetical protein
MLNANMPTELYRVHPVNDFFFSTPMEVRLMRVSLIRFLLSIMVMSLAFSLGCKGTTPASLEPVGELKQISIFNAPDQLNPGQVHPLGAVGVYSGSAQFNITGYATWQSSNVNVIMITGAGLIQAVGGGIANITCTYRGVTSQTVAIGVTGPPNPNGGLPAPVTIESVRIDPVWIQVAIGGTVQFTAYAILSNGETLDNLTPVVDWHVSDVTPGFIIDADNAYAWGSLFGLYKATGPVGSTVVSCTYQGITSNYATVIVKQF